MRYILHLQDVSWVDNSLHVFVMCIPAIVVSRAAMHLNPKRLVMPIVLPTWKTAATGAMLLDFVAMVKLVMVKLLNKWVI